ncbi:DUF3592 domain-containing protein [Nocardiopsis baichengensis]|uniref:DUF3592 domain-containing protein n=1 Tax=Nocardiopsis baichengensis TaxID=280240 RepID=UPI00034D15B3|nr:DUF3592 domain-containing protein [Nocardiopsis baichengensis]
MGIRTSSGKKKLGPGGAMLVIGFVLLIISTVMLVLGMSDYTDHTERADAVVSERRVEVTYTGNDRDRKDRREEITVYVDYTAEDQDFTHVELMGLDNDDFQEGQRLTVAYAPGEAGDVVTVESTEEGAFDVFLYIGIAGAVLTAVLIPTGIVVIARQRK